MPRHRLAPLPALVALAALACATDGPTTSHVALRDGGGERVPVTRLRPEPYPLSFTSGIGQPARLVIRDEPLWRATWAAINGDLTPAPALPAVDFDREMVVVAALGGRPSGGYAIVVDSATRHAATLVVHVRSVSPHARCFVTAALTAPVDAVVAPRHDGPVEFRERAEVMRCD